VVKRRAWWDSLPTTMLSTALDKLLTHTNRYLSMQGRWCSKARKFIWGLALLWPCFTDFVVYSTCGLKDLGKRDEYLRLVLWTMRHLYNTYLCEERGIITTIHKRNDSN